MKRTEIIKEILKAIRAEESATGDFRGKRRRPCDTYTEDIYDLYVDSLLSAEEGDAFEAHLKTCPACCRGLEEAMKREDMITETPLFTEEALSRSLSIKLQYMNDLLDNEEAAERGYLLAASGDSVRTGVARGVAVNYETGQGILLECEAMLMPRKGTTGMIELRGLAVESITSNKREYEFTSPLELLEDQLEDLFETVKVLKRFSLWDWDIAVDITSPEDREGYIFEARSLTLPILMAILYAVTGHKGDPGRVFTGAVGHKGRIKRVGHIADKVRIASAQKASEMIMPWDNRHECTGFATDPNLRIRCFPTLDMLLQELDLISPSDKNKAILSKRAKPPAAHSGRDKKHILLFLLLLAGLGGLGILWRGDIIALSRNILSANDRSADVSIGKQDKGISPLDKAKEKREARVEAVEWQQLLAKRIPENQLASYPYHECFAEQARAANVPLPLILGIASALSCFDNSYNMNNRFGIMGIGWPEPAKSLGFDEMRYLSNPCRNIEAGCRFLAELLHNKVIVDINSALLAYLHQAPEYPFSQPTDDDLSSVERIRAHVEMAGNNAFSQSWYNVIAEFDSSLRAEAYARNIDKLTGIKVFAVNSPFRYQVILVALDEKEKNTLMAIINKATGNYVVE